MLDAVRQGVFGGEPAAIVRGGMGGSTVLVDLRPPGLEISQAEVDFLAQLGGLVSSPRVAKRLVNIYRLARIGVPDHELPGFIGDEKDGPYQIVLVLLAILAGSPAAAEDAFRVLLKAPPADDILSVLQEMQPKAELQEPIARIENEIAVLAAEARLSLTVADYQPWCPALARYSQPLPRRCRQALPSARTPVARMHPPRAPPTAEKLSRLPIDGAGAISRAERLTSH